MQNARGITKIPEARTTSLKLSMNTFTLERFCTILNTESIGPSLQTSLVHNSNALERDEEILVSTGSARAIPSAKVIEVRNLLEDKVDECEDDGNTQRISPYTNDSDDISPVCVMIAVVLDILRSVSSRYKPSEEGEHSCEEIDDENGSDKLE